MKKHLKYLWYLLKHKWYVLRACWKFGVNPWRAVTHDISKFLPSEWFPYAENFFGEWKSGDPESDAYKETAARVKDNFQRAFLLHIHRNPHHWQYWVRFNAEGQLTPVEMPDSFVREMVADWTGAGMAIHGEDECKSWYEANKHTMTLHEMTRLKVAILLYHEEGGE